MGTSDNFSHKKLLMYDDAYHNMYCELEDVREIVIKETFNWIEKYSCRCYCVGTECKDDELKWKVPGYPGKLSGEVASMCKGW